MLCLEMFVSIGESDINRKAFRKGRGFPWAGIRILILVLYIYLGQLFLPVDFPLKNISNSQLY